MKHSEIINKMTLKEKAELVSGENYWYLREVKKAGLPKIMMTDGPNGLRKQNTEKRPDGIGLGNSVPSTCFPPAVTSSCSWDKELLRLEGEAIAEECLAEKVSVILGPGVILNARPYAAEILNISAKIHISRESVQQLLQTASSQRA